MSYVRQSRHDTTEMIEYVLFYQMTLGFNSGKNKGNLMHALWSHKVGRKADVYDSLESIEKIRPTATILFIITTLNVLNRNHILLQYE